MKPADEPHEILGLTVMVQQLVVQAETLCPRRDGQGAHDAQAVVSMPRIMDGSLSHRSPDLPPQRLQQKATFIEKNQAGLPFGSLFLAGATRPGASARWRLRRVRGRDVRASGGSSRAGAEVSPRSPRESSPGTTAQSALLPVGNSNPARENPNSPRQRSRRQANVRDRRMSNVVGGLDVVYMPTRTCRPARVHRSTALPTIHWHQPPQPLPSAFSLAQEAGLQSVDELPAPRDFHDVSYRISIRPTSAVFHYPPRTQ